MAYMYKKRKTKLPETVNRLQATKDGEVLTGYVQGQKASDIEERFAKALGKAIKNGSIMSYEFQPSYIANRNVQGEIRLDFLVHVPPAQPIQIDGTFAHKAAEQKSKDKVKDAILNKHLEGTGTLPVIRIPGNELDTDEMASDALAGAI